MCCRYVKTVQTDLVSEAIPEESQCLQASSVKDLHQGEYQSALFRTACMSKRLLNIITCIDYVVILPSRLIIS